MSCFLCHALTQILRALVIAPAGCHALVKITCTLIIAANILTVHVYQSAYYPYPSQHYPTQGCLGLNAENTPRQIPSYLFQSYLFH